MATVDEIINVNASNVPWKAKNNANASHYCNTNAMRTNRRNPSVICVCNHWVALLRERGVPPSAAANGPWTSVIAVSHYSFSVVLGDVGGSSEHMLSRVAMTFLQIYTTILMLILVSNVNPMVILNSQAGVQRR